MKEYYKKVVQEKQGNQGDFLAAAQVWVEKRNSNPTMARRKFSKREGPNVLDVSNITNSEFLYIRFPISLL